MNDTSTATRSVVIEREIPHPPEKIWRALTQPALLEEWLMRTDLEPQVGRRFAFRADPVPNWDGVIDCEMLEVEPPSRLAYTWSSMGLESVVTWTLTPAGSGGTRVRMEQSGFRPDQKANYQGANYGWRNFLAKLGEVLARLD